MFESRRKREGVGGQLVGTVPEGTGKVVDKDEMWRLVMERVSTVNLCAPIKNLGKTI